MAVINEYKFKGIDNSTTGGALVPLGAGIPGVNETTELLTQPLIVEGGTSFTVQASSTDSFDVAISYLNIKKEKTD